MMEVMSSASIDPGTTSKWFKRSLNDVVEIPITLPVAQAEDLIELAMIRGMSLAQLLRTIIDQELGICR
jgi:hypothetical protein